MAKTDQLLRTIETIHAAGLDAARWPDALSAAADLIGGNGAVFEVLDKKTFTPVEWHGWGIPDVSEVAYIAEYSALSPRPAAGFKGKSGDLLYDRMILDEAGIDRNPFYQEFLAHYGFRYFISIDVFQTRDVAVPFSIQRSRRQGHVGRREIDLMRRITPHVQQAYDVAQRLKGAHSAARALERAFDWLADGAMLVASDGAVTYANIAMQAIARRGDGLRFVKGRLEFSDRKATARYAATLGAIARLYNGAADANGGDFAAMRGGGAPPYLVSVRPLANETAGKDGARAAIVFVHDPLGRNSGASLALRELFGLTDAEAALAEALQGGASLSDYTRDKRLSLNTVYTHLRRIKEKTGAKRLPDLIRRLNDLKLPLRRD